MASTLVDWDSLQCEVLREAGTSASRRSSDGPPVAQRAAGPQSFAQAQGASAARPSASAEGDCTRLLPDGGACGGGGGGSGGRHGRRVRYLESELSTLRAVVSAMAARFDAQLSAAGDELDRQKEDAGCRSIRAS